jgi:hypothetical protein
VSCDWYFNLDPTLDPTSLVFSNPVKTGSFADPSVDLGTNAHQADGDGKFDVRFNFAHAKPHRFGPGESALVTLSGVATLNVDSFNFMSAPGGANGGFGSAAHVQGIGETPRTAAGWVTRWARWWLSPSPLWRWWRSARECFADARGSPHRWGEVA